MALNALRTEVVSFTGTPGIEANGIIVGYRPEYTPRTSTEAKYHAIEGRTSDVASDANHKGQYYIQLGEQLYDGKLKLKDDIDVFGRPSRKWEYDGKGIGTYAKKELLDKEYVGEVTGKDLFDELGSTTLKDYTTYAFIDGVYTDADAATKTALGAAYFNAADMNKNNKAGVGGTGTGTLTQVYVDHDKDVVYVVVINTYLAIASKDYDTKKEEVDIAAYSIKKDASISEYIKVAKDGTKKVTFKLAIEDFDEAADIKKDDPLLITVADGEVQTIKPAEVLSAVTITAFKLKSNVTVDGTKYSYTTTAGYKDGDLGEYTTTEITRLKDRTYNVYLDVYGNLIGVEEVEAVKNYVFITGIDLNGSNRHNQTADASAIFLDGTMDSIKVNMTKSEWKNDPIDDDDDSVLNTWCTYTKNGDVYTLKEVSDVGVTTVGNQGQFPANVPSSTNGKLAQFNQQCTTGEMTIDSKNYRMYGGGAKSSDYYNVYGDVDTVYLTVELGELVKGGEAGTNYGIIDDVASVSTGIANTDLTVWNNTKAAQQAADSKPANGTPGVYPKTSSGVYGLYNDKGLIIAAIVVGEDAGTAKDLVYVHTSTLEEEIDNGGSTSKAAGDGLWTWTRKVIRNGEEVLLTEVGDYYDGNHSLSKMEQYKWYQVRTNGAGNVIEAKEASVALSGQTSSRFVTDYDKINDNVEAAGVKTVLYLTNGGPVWNASKKAYDNGYSGDLEVKGNRTLAITDAEGSGIWFRDDVNVVLQYWNRNKQMDDIFTGEGVDDLKEMVDIVNDNNDYRDSNDYFVSALIEDGRATTIVIFDAYNNYTRPDDSKTPGSNGDVTYADGVSATTNGAISGDKVTVTAAGRVTVDLTLAKPDWAFTNASNGITSIDYEVYIDGEYDYDGSVNLASALTANDTYTAYSVKNLSLNDANLTKADAKGHTVSIVITEVVWDAARVKHYEMNTAGTAKVRELPTKATTDYFLTTDDSTGGTLRFAINDGGSTTGTYTVVGASLKDGETANETVSSSANAGSTVKYVADGGKVVEVLVKPDAAIAARYVVGAQGTAGDVGSADPSEATNIKLKGAGAIPVSSQGGTLAANSDELNAWVGVAATPGNVVDEGDWVTYDITYYGHRDSLVTGVKISYNLTVGGKTTSGSVEMPKFDVANPSETVRVGKAASDIDLTITGVTMIVEQNRFEVAGATVATDKKSITITFKGGADNGKADHFSNDITFDGTGNTITVQYDSTGSNKWTLTADCVKVNSDGSVTITAAAGDASNVLANGGVITIDAPIETSTGKQVKACTITLATDATAPGGLKATVDNT